MTKVIKDLLLALLNATLILLALCLFLGWKVVDRANAITETFASSLISLDPIRDEIAGTREEVAGLRSDLAALSDSGGTLGDAALDRMSVRVDAVGDRFDAIEANMQDIRTLPYDLTDHAIKTAAEEFGQTITSLVAARQPR